MNPLKGKLTSRLLAAVLVSIPVGYLYAQMEQRKLQGWADNPAAAQAVQLHLLGDMSSFWIAALSLAAWLVILTLCVEGVSFLIRGEWRSAGNQSA